jgi:hypothetical protein
MRVLTSNAQTKIAIAKGNEPINIVSIYWSPLGNPIHYADKEITGFAKAAILDLSVIDNVIDLSRNSETFEISVTLDDTDGTIKEIIDSYDIHKRPCIIYQHFEGSSIADRFILFKGEINTPITWSEGSRQLSFSIVSSLENQEIGFSPDQAALDVVDYEAIGEPWPMVFGEVPHVPAVKIKEAPTGSLKEPIGYPDQTLYSKRVEIIRRLKYINNEAAFLWAFSNAVKALGIDAKTALDTYLSIILVEDNDLPFRVALNNRFMQLGLALGNARTKKAKQAIQNQRDNIQNILLNLPTLLATDKQRVKQVIDTLKHLQEVRQDLKQRAIGMWDEAGELLILLIEIEQAIVDQEATIRQDFGVGNGSKFPQGEVIDILVNGLRMRGSFDEDVFHQTIEPQPTYTNVQLDPRESDQVDALWIHDPLLTLKGMYIAVTIRKTFTNPDGTTYTEDYPAILKVTDQYGRKILVELTEKSESDMPDTPTIVDTKKLAPDITNYSKQILLAGNAKLPLTDEEFNNIRELEALVPKDGSGLVVPILLIEAHEKYEYVAAEIIAIHAVAPVILGQWLNGLSPEFIEALPSAEMFYADAGSEVRLADDFSVHYVSNITPGEVVAVYAHKVINNKRQLALIPENYYEEFAENLGGITATGVKLRKPLSTIEGEQWEDDIYVSVESEVGPNTVDVLEYLISTYASGFTFDVTTFNSVKAKINNYPSHFYTAEQKNLIDALKEIAWQARCAIWIKEDKFYLRYLSETPTPTATITESDIESGSLELFHSPTEDIVTKVIATWTPDYAKEEPLKWVLRHNVAKYGVMEESYDFYIYTDGELVEKSATFWLIRYSNTWKHVRFKTFLQNLEVETLDCIEIDLSKNHISNGSVLAIVEKASYDSANNIMEIEAWLPIKAGGSGAYDFFWPSSVDADQEFPTEEEIFEGLAGSGPPTSDISGSVTGSSGGGGGTIRARDYGRQFPSDAADQAPANPLAVVPDANNPKPNKGKASPKVPSTKGRSTEATEEPPVKPPLKEVKLGIILAVEDISQEVQFGADTKVTVLTNTNEILEGFTRKAFTLEIKSGSQCVLVWNELVNRWDAFVQHDFQWIKKVSVENIHENYLDVVDFDDNNFKVMKPFRLQKQRYHGKVIDGIRYWDIEGGQRVAVKESDPVPDPPPENGLPLETEEILWVETLWPNYYFTSPDPSNFDDDDPEEQKELESKRQYILIGQIQDFADTATEDADNEEDEEEDPINATEAAEETERIMEEVEEIQMDIVQLENFRVEAVINYNRLQGELYQHLILPEDDRDPDFNIDGVEMVINGYVNEINQIDGQIAGKNVDLERLYRELRALDYKEEVASELDEYDNEIKTRFNQINENNLTVVDYNKQIQEQLLLAEEDRDPNVDITSLQADIGLLQVANETLANQADEIAKARKSRSIQERLGTYWIDLNVDGRNWQPIREYMGKMKETHVVTRAFGDPPPDTGLDVIVGVYSGVGEEKQVTISSGINSYYAHHNFRKDDRVIVRLFDNHTGVLTEEYNPQIVQHTHVARFITFKITVEVQEDDSTVSTTELVSWSDGYEPNLDDFPILNEMCYTAESGGVGYAVYDDSTQSYKVWSLNCCNQEEA